MPDLSANVIEWKKCDYKFYAKGLATVAGVLGEFYWKVEVGEEVQTRDLIHPPEALSIETAQGEQNVSLGIYARPAEIEQAFGVKNLRRPWSIGMNQPGPSIGFVTLSWIVFAVLMILIDLTLSARKTPVVDQRFLFYALFLISIIPIAALVYRISFESRRWQNSSVGS
jgi:hypothetical protein